MAEDRDVREDGAQSEGSAEAAAHGPATEGLDRLDQDRAASLADEGGASGAAVESQEARRGRRPADGRDRRARRRRVDRRATRHA